MSNDQLHAKFQKNILASKILQTSLTQRKIPLGARRVNCSFAVKKLELDRSRKRSKG